MTNPFGTHTVVPSACVCIERPASQFKHLVALCAGHDTPMAPAPPVQMHIFVEQLRSFEPPQAVVSYLPVPQERQSAHCRLVVPPQAVVWYFPGPQERQVAHCRLVVPPQAVVWYLPAPQIVQVVHCRLVVPPQAVVSYLPALQNKIVQGVHILVVASAYVFCGQVLDSYAQAPVTSAGLDGGDAL